MRTLGLIFFILAEACKLSAQLPPLSQNTNEEILLFDDKIFISSTDGLNVTNGITNKVYRPPNYNMADNIVQGRFHVDDEKMLWMTTYTGLHRYLPEVDDFEIYLLPNKSGDTIQADYSIIRSLSDTTLMMELSEEVVFFNTKCKCVQKRFQTNVQVYAPNDACEYNGKLFLAAGIGRRVDVFVSEGDSMVLYDKLEFPINRVWFYQGALYCGGTGGNVDVYDLQRKKWRSKTNVDNSRINYFSADSENNIWISSMDALMTLDPRTNRLLDRIEVTHPANGSPLHGLMRPYVHNGDRVFIGSDGDGVFSAKLKLSRFNNFNSIDNISDVTELFEADNGHIYIGTRSGEIFEIDLAGALIASHQPQPNQGSLDGLAYMSGNKEGLLLMSNFYGLWSFDYNTNKFELLSKEQSKYGQIESYDDSSFLVSTGLNYLLKLSDNFKTDQFDTLARLEEAKRNPIFYHFFFDQEKRIYINDNLEKVEVFDHGGINRLASIPISGITCLQDLGDFVLAANVSGLYQIDKANWSYSQILDENKHLQQQIYAVLVDDIGYYWLSTNNGIYRYNPNTNHAHQFKMSDGLQGMEFNTMSFLEDSKGRFYFGGQQGLNMFDPLEISLSDKQAVVDFYNYKINDEDSRAFGVSNYVNHIDLYEKNNTITFEFVGIDFDDPKAVNLKYYMEGYDKHWVVLDENDGLARYGNLPYGEYTFHMLASNADEVWSDTGKSMSITVHPPFWATWWFRILVALSLLGIGYSAIRNYFQRKLERQNLMLKQQALVIEKNEAIEHERSRIASEMHDDLGSGLTTIKYLSERAMKSYKDDEDKSKIKSIANHANTLVSNMSEIIWAMNSRYDTVSDLIGYIRRYASIMCEDNDKKLNFEAGVSAVGLSLGGEKRRNIFLVSKEILHNFIKHSTVDSIRIDINNENQSLSMEFLEIGSEGFDFLDKSSAGNGLYNMQKRMDHIGGNINRMITERGMLTVVTVALNET